MFTQKSIKIFHSVQEIRPFSHFQNLALGKASIDDKCHFAIVSLFFRILLLLLFVRALRRFQQFYQDGVWLRQGAKFHNNIPLSAIITFSEFGARQSLDQ